MINFNIAVHVVIAAEDYQDAQALLHEEINTPESLFFACDQYIISPYTGPVTINLHEVPFEEEGD